MIPKTLLQLSDSFQTLDIEEAGLYKTIDANIFSSDYMKAASIDFVMDGISLDPSLGMFTLAPRVEYDRLSNVNYWMGYLGTPIQDLTWETINRQDSATPWFAYLRSNQDHYPIAIQSEPGVLYNDQSFCIDVIKSSIGENADKTYCYMFICIKGITPNAINTFFWNGDPNQETEEYEDTLVIALPLYKNEPIKYGFAQWQMLTEGIAWNHIDDVCRNTYDLGVQSSSIDRWLTPGANHHIMFRMLENYLYVSSSAFGGAIPISTGENFSIQDPQIKLLFTAPCSPIVRFGDIKYQTAGSISFKARVGYSSTQVADVKTDVFRVTSDTSSDVALSKSTIIGEYAFGELLFSSDTDIYTPVIHRFNIVVPPKYSRNSGFSPVDISNKVMSWNINRSVSGVPTATIQIDNGNMEYSYSHYAAWVGKQVRIWGGYEESGITPRFTGIVTDISLDRSSPSICSITLSCKGMSSKLDKVAMFDREYDGDYHTDAILDLLSCAEISSCIIETADSKWDKLYYGKNEPKYAIKLGDTYRTLVNSILDFSGFVLSEDEWGNVVYAHKSWRNDGIQSFTEYGDADYSNTYINPFKKYDTIIDISSINFSTTNDNVRNVVQVIGLADKDIDPSPAGLYPAYKRGDKIRVSLENQELIDRIGYLRPLVLLKPELTTPEQCLLVAKRVLRLVSEAEKKASINILGDNTLHPGMVIPITDDYLLDNAMYIISETMTENYNNGTYINNIDGPLTLSPPEDY